MTDEQKEEYNYRFKDIELPYTNLIYNLLLLWLIFGISLMFALMSIKEYVEISIHVLEYLISMVKVSYIFVYATLIDVIIKYSIYIYRKYQERKFLKGLKQ